MGAGDQEGGRDRELSFAALDPARPACTLRKGTKPST
jgi:hypothetical protein